MSAATHLEEVNRFILEEGVVLGGDGCSGGRGSLGHKNGSVGMHPEISHFPEYSADMSFVPHSVMYSDLYPFH